MAWCVRRLRTILAAAGARHVWDVFGIPENSMGPWARGRPVVVSIDLGMRNLGLSVLTWPQRDMGTAENSCEIFGPVGGEWPYVQTLLVDLFPPGQQGGAAQSRWGVSAAPNARMLLSYWRQVHEHLLTPYAQLLGAATFVLVEKPYMSAGRYSNPGVPLFVLANVLGAVFGDRLVFVDPAEIKRWLGWTARKHPRSGVLPLGGRGSLHLSKAGPQGYIARKADALRVAREAALALEALGMGDREFLSARLAGAHKGDDMADSLLNLLVWMAAAFHKVPCYVYDADVNGGALTGLAVAMQALYGAMEGDRLGMHLAVQRVLMGLPA